MGAAGRLTILQAHNKRLAKIYEHDNKGRIVKRGYDKAGVFSSRAVDVPGVDELADLLRRLQRHPDCCVIMAGPGKWHPGFGRPVLRRIYAADELADDAGRFQKPARKGAGEEWQRREIEAGRLRPVTVLPMFEERPTCVLLLDFDGLAAPAGVEWRDDLAWTGAFLRMRLPAEFHAARCVYYATGSAADLTKPDLGGAEIRMRLGFVLDRGVSAAQAKRWLAGVQGLDKSTLNPAQPTYTAGPVFCDGLVDPMPERLGVLDGARELVPVPEIQVEQRLRREAFVSLGPVRSAEGLGLLAPHPHLDAALEQLEVKAGAAGTVRAGLIQAAFAYARDAGRDHVDIDALAAFLAEAAERYRSAAEVAGYGIEGAITWALDHAPADPPPRPHYPEQGLSAQEATARLREEMAAAVGAAAAWQAVSVTDDAPVVGIKAGAGLGKTGCALEQIAAIPGIEQMNVEIYVPDHGLAEELASRVRGVRPLRVLVIRGRGDPHNPKALCKKAALADEVGKAGLNVMSTMCRAQGAEGFAAEECGFAKKCRYLAQFRDNSPAIRIMPHASMFVRRNRELPSPDLIVIDESFWRGAVRHPELALDRLTEAGRWRSRPRKGEAPFKAADRLLEAEDFALRVRNALQDGRDPRTVVTAEQAEHVASVEWGSRGGPGITPAMGYQAQQKAWSSWQRDECSKAGRFWNLLAAEHEFPDRPLQRIVLERDAPTKDGDRRHLLHLHYRRELHLAQVPVILLDADLDPVIAGKFFPALRMIEIPVRQLADIVQVVDRSCSMRFLLGEKGDGDHQRADRQRAGKRMRELERFAGRVLADGGLFVSYKGALDRVTLPAGVDAVHLGNLRGRDTYKHHDVAVIAGRLEPGVRAIENRARAIFGDEAEAIVTVAEGDHRPRYPTEQRRYRVAGGVAGAAVAVAAHPDPRAQALLEQIREREIEQAVARLRLVHRDRPARVFLLTNVPLNLEITELTGWNTLARDREAEACTRWGGLWLCSAGERARAAPDLWATAEAARPVRGGKGWSESSRECSRGVLPPFSAYPGWGQGLARDACTLVQYRYPGQRGSPHQALVPGEVWCPETCRAYLEDVLGPVGPVIIVRTVHRAPIVDVGEPEALVVPVPTPPPNVHVLDVHEAWRVGAQGLERWNLHSGHELLLPVAMADELRLVMNFGGHPQTFTRAGGDAP